MAAQIDKDSELRGSLHMGPYRTMQSVVVMRLRDAILAEEFPPAERLPPLRDLAEMFGTSTMPVREAIRALASEGLVDLHPHRGTTVAPLSFAELEELYMTRVGLEGRLARLGAERCTDPVLAEMLRLVKAMEAAEAQADDVSFLEYDRAFHLAHYGAADRPRLLDRVELYKRYAARYTRRIRQTPEDRRLTREYHNALLDACTARDGRRAEQLVRADLDRAVDYMRAHLEVLEPSSRDEPRHDGLLDAGQSTE